MLICILLQLNIQNRIEAILDNPSTKFEKIVLTLEAFQKVRQNEKEILLDGKMYDIKKAVFNANTVELIAYHDSKEESIISLIENFFDCENCRKDFSHQVLKLLVSVYTFSTQQFEFVQGFFSGTFFNAHTGWYLSFTAETLSPPPDLLS